ncbi:MAG: hypothetical protein C3F02_03900 [Parcubacteria group bacterium]|nr:MAG: hypothetical protein C3F02_03900 [Parcubacteria group bacterium]
MTIPMDNFDKLSIILAVLTAVASGLLGSFALMRRMALAGDAFSHIALPGIALALLFHVNPIIGGAVALIIGAFIIWRVEKLSGLNTEAVTGVLFTVSLALGALTIGQDHELVDTLFGGISKFSVYEFIIGVIVALIIIIFVIYRRHALVLSLISKDLAKTAHLSTEKLEWQFLLLFALTVVLGLKFLGVLLMGSLIIIPAAIARNLAHNLNSLLIISALSAVLAMVGGMILSTYFALQLGPAIIIVAGGLFVLSLLRVRSI